MSLSPVIFFQFYSNYYCHIRHKYAMDDPRVMMKLVNCLIVDLDWIELDFVRFIIFFAMFSQNPNYKVYNSPDM